MPDPEYRLCIEREDDELLIIEGLDLVRAFIDADPSAQPGGYDSLAGKGNRERISADDVTTVNKTMRARAKRAYWQPVLDGDQQWLADIPTTSTSSRPRTTPGRPPTATSGCPKRSLIASGRTSRSPA